METNFDLVELGIVVNLRTLREVLKALCVGTSRFWLACDPEDARIERHITIGLGDSAYIDRLNNVFFRLPIIGDCESNTPVGMLLILVEPTTTIPAGPGYYIDHGRVIRDSLEDFQALFQPLKHALIRLLQEGG